MKKNGRTWPPDIVVEEVRAVRSELWQEAGETLEGFQELANRLYEQSQIHDQGVPTTARRKKKKPTRAVRKK